jgi:hypothetical protein
MMSLKNKYPIHISTAFFYLVLLVSCNKSSESLQEENNTLHVFNDVAYYSRPTDDGGLIVLSSKFLIKNIYQNEKNIVTFLSKINSNGEKSWTINFESYITNYNYFFPRTVNVLRDSGFIVIAQFNTPNNNVKHLLLLKISGNGNIVLTREIIPSRPWKGPYYDIVQTSDNNFVLTDGENVCRMNSTGSALWSYSNTTLYESYLLLTFDNGIIISSNEYSTCSRLKLNAMGEILWQELENGINNVWRQTTVADINGNDFVISGSNIHSENLDLYLETFSNNGDSKNFVQIPGILNEYCHFVLHTRDGGFLLVGTTTQANVVLFDDEVFPDFNSRIIAVKLDATMNIKWTKTYGGTYGSKGICVNETSDGNFLLLGNQVSYSNPNVINMLVLKINKDGNM